MHTFLNRVEPGSSEIYKDKGNLLKEAIGTLKGRVGPEDTSIAFESNAALEYYRSLGYALGECVFIIDEEIISGFFDGAGNQLNIRNCQRGYRLSTKGSHAQGAEVGLVPFWDGFAFELDPRKEGQKKSARSFADFAQRAGLNFIYGDSASAAPLFGMDSWSQGFAHYFLGQRPYIKEINHPVIMQTGEGYAGTPQFYYIQKGAMWDSVGLKAKEYIRNFRVRDSKAKEGDNPYIDSSGEFGWQGIYRAEFASGKNDYDATTPDDIHYMMAKTFAYRTFISLVPAQLFNHDLDGLYDIIGLYHKLFDDEVKGLSIPEIIYKRLQDKDTEAELNTVNGYNFVQKKVVQKNASGLGQAGFTFSFENPFAEQKLKLELRPRLDYYPFSDSRHLVVKDFSQAGGVTLSGDNASFRCELGQDGVLTIHNDGTGVGSCSLNLPMPPAGSMDLTGMRGMGLEMSGDGKKELVIVRLDSLYYGLRDFELYPDNSRKAYILNDAATGTKSIVYSESGQSFEAPMDTCRRSFSFDYSRAKVTIEVLVGPGSYRLQFHSLKALKEKENSSPLKSPSVSINARKITFPVTLYVDDTRPHILIYDGYAKKYQLLTSNYRKLSEGSIDDTITLPNGVNNVVLNADGQDQGNSTRADMRISVYDDEDNDGIPTNGDFDPTQSVYKGPSRLNFYDDNLPNTYNPDQKDPNLPGDISGDSRITNLDAALASYYSVGFIQLSGEQVSRGDLSLDGQISAWDAALIVKKE